MKNRDKENIDNVLDGVEAGKKAQKKDQNGRAEVKLSTGVKLKIRPVPRHFLYEVSRRFVRPEPPTYFNEGKGRDEVNEADPEYAAQLEKYLGDVATAGTDTALLFGTEIGYKPKGVPGPDSKAFIQQMEILGLERLDNSKARYLYWVKSIAAPLTRDINILLEELGRLSGVAESDVEDAVARFRSITARGEDRSAESE